MGTPDVDFVFEILVNTPTCQLEGVHVVHIESEWGPTKSLPSAAAMGLCKLQYPPSTGVSGQLPSEQLSRMQLFLVGAGGQHCPKTSDFVE
jgi:hypothetical protein